MGEAPTYHIDAAHRADREVLELRVAVTYRTLRTDPAVAAALDFAGRATTPADFFSRLGVAFLIAERLQQGLPALPPERSQA